MSYIVHKEKIFSSKKKNIVRKRSDCNLRSIASCTDSRAWGTSAHDLRQYILDTINGSASSVGKFIPPKVLIDILIKQKNNFRKNYNIMKKKSSSAENLSASKKNKTVKDEEVGQGDFIRTDDEEVLNLRRLVKDLGEKLNYLENVKQENSKLRSEINSEAQKLLEEALLENKSLEAKLEAYSNLHLRNKELTKKAENFKSESEKLKVNIEQLEEKNKKLGAKLKEMIKKRDKEKAREMSISNAKVDNIVLRERLTSREDKIKFLATIVDHQELQITELVSQIEHMATAFAWKEERMAEKLNGFKRIAEINCDKAYESEKKLALCEMMIKELETMRNQFRHANCMLKENMIFYKNQFEVVAAKGVLMGHTIEELLQELSTREDKISRLSHFPPTAKTIIYFSQLKGMLQDDKIYKMNANGLKVILGRMREVLQKLNEDAWVSQGIELPISLCDSFSQTVCCLKESSSQHIIIYREKITQTQEPEELIVKYITAGLTIKVFIKVINNLEEKIKNQKDHREKLEKEIVTCLNEKLKLEELVNNINLEVTLYKENNNKLMEDLKIANEANSKMVYDLKNELDLHKGLILLFDLSIENNHLQLKSYCKILQAELDLSKEQVKSLSFYIINDLCEQRREQANYTEILESNLLLMETVMMQEVEINQTLENEIFQLNGMLTSKDDMFRKAVRMYESCEKKLIQLEHLLNVDKKDSMEVEHFNSDSEMSNTSQFDKIAQCLMEREKKLNTLIEEKSSLERELHTSLTSVENFKRIINKTNAQSNILRNKLYRININVKRVKKCLTSLRMKLNKSTTALEILKTANEELERENYCLHNTNLKCQKENENNKKILGKSKKTINCLISENEDLCKEKQKMSEVMDQFCIELENYKKISHKIVTNSSTSTHESMVEYDRSMKIKDNCINDLMNQIQCLKDQLGQLEKIKTESIISIGNQTTNLEVGNAFCQSDFDDNETEKYLSVASEMKNNYENIIDTLQKEHLKEMERENKQYLNNLSMLKETYERDIKRIKLGHAENLKKMQSFHEEEVLSLKKANQEVKVKEIDISSIEEKSRIELEKMKRYYQDLLDEKNNTSNKEKEILQQEMTKYLAEKDLQIQEITKQMDINLKNVKKKCKNFVKKIQDENSLIIENLNKEFDARLEEEIKQRQCEITTCALSSASKSDNHDKELNSEESEDGYLDTIPILECKNDTSPTIIDDRRCLLRRISQLEEELLKKDLYASENACDTEKRIWKERERCKEVSLLLDREVERNEKLRAKLSVEYHKTAELELLNLSLKRKLSRHMEREKRKPRKFEKLNFSEMNFPKVLSDEYGSDYSNLTVEFIQQCGIHHNFKQSSKENINET